MQPPPPSLSTKKNGNRFDLSSIHPLTSSSEIYVPNDECTRLLVARKRWAFVPICSFSFRCRHFRVEQRFFFSFRLIRRSVCSLLYFIIIIIIFRSHRVLFLWIQQSVLEKKERIYIYISCVLSKLSHIGTISNTYRKKKQQLKKKKLKRKKSRVRRDDRTKHQHHHH